MRERINRLARGIVDSEVPKLFLSPTAVEETLGNNTVYKRELYLSSENNLYIKGLAYSTHPRVRILTGSYGGLRNRIGYEVDTAFCENGDEIRGSIDLVTNSGEISVPFVFYVETSSSVRILATLKTPEDFLSLAQKDMDLALRLMEYRDFTEAPFLQNVYMRTVLEGLRGHGNRQNALEEFFLSLGLKEPIELTLSASKKTYERLRDVTADKIVLRKNTWGYLYLEVQADGDFIELPKKVVTQADFEDGRFELRYKIHPERMHRGKNLGAIRLVSVHGETVVSVEAMGESGTESGTREKEISKAGICRYMKLRQAYEAGGGEDEALRKQIEKELDAIRGVSGASLLLSLLQAEVLLDQGMRDRAAQVLCDCQEDVPLLYDRVGTLFCYFQYLQYRLEPTEEKLETLLRLLRKKTDEKRNRFYLYLLLLKLKPELYEEEGALYDTFRSQFESGCHSPFLYMAAMRLFSRNPSLLKYMDEFEIHVLFYGAKHGMVSRELALRAASAAVSAKFFDRLCYKTLAMLYEVYPEREILEGICGLLIKGNCRGEEWFSWYEKGVEQEISLTRLYEYYLYSLPEKYNEVLPRQVLLYFSFEHSQLDRHSRSVLYENVLTFLTAEDSLYGRYERAMEKFAMEQLFESRINSRLAVIYKHMIYRDIIDAQVARVLPPILRTSRIFCKDRAMKYVVVCNDALAREDAYPLSDGVAYVPLYFDNSVILFQDMYGNRYVDVEFEREPVLKEPDMEARCFELAPDHPMLLIRACAAILEKESIDGEDVSLLQKTLDELPLKPLYQQKLLKKLIEYYQQKMRDGEEEAAREGGAYLLRLDKQTLSRAERVGICSTLAAQGYFDEAYEMVRQFGTEGADEKMLPVLCSKTILNSMFDEDEGLLKLAARMFLEGKSDGIVLDYLCEHFNGRAETMFRMLSLAVREHVETYDMEERLLAQLLFTGNGKYLDQTFDLYVSRNKKTSESVVKAYFTVKCVGYFLKDIVPGDKVFAYLETAVRQSEQMRKVPEIYLMTLAKFYSTLPSLSKEQAEICKKVMETLLEAGMVFSWFKKLSRYADIPGDILDKEMIEYHGSADRRPVLKIRILPDEEEFHTEEMRMVYKGIYVRQKVLFEGEIMEYQIWEEQDDGSQVKTAEGEIACSEIPAGDKDNRFSRLNAMGLYLGMKDDRKLAASMIKYVTDDLAAEKLFPLD